MSFNHRLKVAVPSIGMETLSSLEAFVRSAELASFSAAARRLAITPAAVSKSVAKLEASLGVRLFQRTTRKLTLTEAGEHLLADAARGLGVLQDAIDRVAGQRHEPSGTLKVSLPPSLGRDFVLPMMTRYREACPRVRPELCFEARQVDLVAEGYDVALGGGLELGAAVVARELAQMHIVAIAGRSYVEKRGKPRTVADLHAHDHISFRSSRNGKLRAWTLRNAAGEQASATDVQPHVVVTDVDAMVASARAGLGIALVPMSQALGGLASGELVRVLPAWWAEGGPLLVYFAGHRLLPARTRVFVDLLVEHFRREKLARKFRGD